MKKNELLIHASNGRTLEHYAECKKPDAKGRILYDFTDVKSRIGKSVKTENKLVVSREWKPGEPGSDCFLIGVMPTFWN